MSSFFFSTPVDVDIVLEGTDERQTVEVKLDKNRSERAPLYMDGESVKGAVTVRPKDGRRLEHTGIKVQFIGLIGATSLHTSRQTRDLHLGKIADEAC
jgi:vacuolar protein sorting-associated protein 26